MVDFLMATIGVTFTLFATLWLIGRIWRFAQPLGALTWRVGKAVALSVCLYASIVLAVAACAAVIGVLTLQDGHLGYLADPGTLFWYVWHKRAGLKVQILFVSIIIYLLLTVRRVGQH
jgi:hypothetical protein